ncbi:MAG: hypothetical protein JO323_00900 [Acidobacteriia bacterium]|nr:hypothetical protein [Terriglobia bacterium]
MRLFAIALLLAAGMPAQVRNASPLIRGVLVDRDAPNVTGQFSVRTADNQVFRYRFDPKTYVEREDRLIDVARLDPGEKVEVLSDEGPATALRYARTIHVMLPAPPRRPLTMGRLRAYQNPIDHYAPLGNLSFSGVVSELRPGVLKLRTREGREQSILLRQDTRYLENGDTVDAGALQPTMRVFVRAGRNLFNEIEAYQIVWGEILAPQ